MVAGSKTIDLEMSDHKLVSSTMNLTVTGPSRIINTRDYKLFNIKKFQADVQSAPWSVCQAFDNVDDAYWAWSTLFNNICDDNAPPRRIKVRSQSLPWITGKLRRKMNLRYKLLRKTNWG